MGWLSSEFNEDVIKSYNEKTKEIYCLEVDVQYHESLYELQNDLAFFSEIKKIQKVKKLMANLRNKRKYIFSHKKFKTSIKSRISFEKKIINSLNLSKNLKNYSSKFKG